MPTEKRQTVKHEVSCPGCGDMAPLTSRNRGDIALEFVDCQKCGLSWGRTVGGSGSWIVLGQIDSKGLLISRRPHSVGTVGTGGNTGAAMWSENHKQGKDKETGKFIEVPSAQRGADGLEDTHPTRQEARQNI